MATRTRRFSNIIELKKGVEALCAKALESTLIELKEILRKKIFSDIYNKPKGLFYERTRILYAPDIIILKMWNAFSANRVGGTLKFDEAWYDKTINLANYQHGNYYFGDLPMESYLEVLNNRKESPKYADSPYSYLGFHKVERKPFWDDFLAEVESRGGFEGIYKKYFDKYIYTGVRFGETYYMDRSKVQSAESSAQEKLIKENSKKKK